MFIKEKTWSDAHSGNARKRINELKWQLSDWEQEVNVLFEITEVLNNRLNLDELLLAVAVNHKPSQRLKYSTYLYLS